MLREWLLLALLTTSYANAKYTLRAPLSSQLAFNCSHSPNCTNCTSYVTCAWCSDDNTCFDKTHKPPPPCHIVNVDNCSNQCLTHPGCASCVFDRFAGISPPS